jgi:endonuclease/exonuclease/phosphatase family metal-dependent hydrolase
VSGHTPYQNTYPAKYREEAVWTDSPGTIGPVVGSYLGEGFRLEANGIRVMSFNIRGSSRDRGKTNAWVNRASANVETIERCAPDLIGFQEFQRGNLKTYRQRLRGYAHILGPRYANRPPHSFNAIFFDPVRLEVLDSGGFWLSRTPQRYSASWGTRVVRSANWALFASQQTGLTFLYLNTHLDHVSAPARREGSELVLRKLAEISEYSGRELPLIVTGDFNCRPGTPTYLNFIEGGFVDAYLAAGNEESEDANTFHAFKGSRYRDAHPGRGPRRIDWILLNDPNRRLAAKSCVIVRDEDESSGVYPSDHYPVLADLVPAG